MFFIFADSATFWQIGFQNPATPIMEGLINLHHHILFFLIITAVFVLWITARVFMHFFYEKYLLEIISTAEVMYESEPDEFLDFYIVGMDQYVPYRNWDYRNIRAFSFYFIWVSAFFLERTFVYSKFTHHSFLEVIWTIIPTIILIFIAIPSFIVLYCMDEIVNAAITLKVIGHQWYWSYEYSDYFLNYFSAKTNSIVFDSYMIPEDELEKGQLRLLEVDNRIILPIKTNIRVLITAADVLHAWAVPSLGIKIDAVPGRLNQGTLFIKRPGIFFGQCSEICGVNHAFMPIVVEAVELEKYLNWLLVQKDLAK